MSRASSRALPLPKPLAADPWLLKQHRFEFRRTPILLLTARDLFSSAALDVGTDRLLRLLAKRDSPLAAELGRPLDVLDLGCGAGALGVAIARALPCGAARVTMTDRDHLAVRVSRQTARQNQLDPRSATLRMLDAGFGYGPCRAAGAGPFDLIVSNLPAKAGAAGLRELLLGGGRLLRGGGALAFVHVTPLAQVIDALRAGFTERFGPVEVLAESLGREHRALLWRLPEGLPEAVIAAGGAAPEIAGPLKPWRRAGVPKTIHLPGLPPYDHLAVADVEEFDTENHRTPLLAKVLAADPEPPPRAERVLILNPRHGFLAARIAHERWPATLSLIARDTLELAVARANLRAALLAFGLTERVALAAPQVVAETPWLPAPAGEQGGFHLIAGHLEWKEGPAAHLATLQALAAALAQETSSRIALAAASGQMGALKSLARQAGLAPGRERSRRGAAALLLRRA